MKSWHSLCVALLLVAASSYAAAAAEKPTGKVTDYGILKFVSRNPEATKQDSPTGDRIEVRGVEVVKKTAEIPASLGTSFGLFFTITGLPAEEPVALKKVVTSPEITKPDGKKQTTYTVPLEIKSDAQGTIATFEGYQFTEPYELAVGEWTFEIWQGDERLVRQVFSVVKP